VIKAVDDAEAEMNSKLSALLMAGDLEGMISSTKTLFEDVLAIAVEDSKHRAEEWRYSRVKEEQESSLEVVQEIILRAGQIIRDTQKQITDVSESIKKTQEEQARWREDKEREFEQQTSGISDRMQSELQP